jgi:hypothetical protein
MEGKASSLVWSPTRPQTSDETTVSLVKLTIDTAILNFNQPQHETDNPKHIRRTYTVRVPPHISPGDHFIAVGNDGTRMLVTCPSFNATARRDRDEVTVLRQPQQKTNKPKHKITCIVKIPPHISPGDHFFATFHSNRMLVMCPSFAQPGTVIRVTQRVCPFNEEHYHRHYHQFVS